MATQQITGLASGMDTASIVQQLMDIEKVSYNKLDVKKQTEELKLQAYQAVNSMLQKFKTSVSSLSSQKLWNSRSASSSNEGSLTATANQYAGNGSYSFRVAQMATSAEFRSKGVADAKAALGAQNADGTNKHLGTITLNSSKAKIDQSAKVETLNGGRGMFRGSIRITDGRGNSAVVDLSAVDTINDVVAAINNASGVQVRAAVEDDGSGNKVLTVHDESAGSGKMRIQNVGQGTTATDLGIAATAASDGGPIVGRSIHYLSRDTELANLRDGLGVEQGVLAIVVSDGTAANGILLDPDLSRARTAGDVIDAVNAAIEDAIAQGATELEGLKFGFNAAKNGFSFTGAKAGLTYTIGDLWGDGAIANPQVAEQLGLAGSHFMSTDGSIDGDRLLGDVDSPMLKNINGANNSGIGLASGSGSTVPVQLTGTTLLSELNGGKGLAAGGADNLFKIEFYEGNGDNRREIDVLDYNGLQAILNDPAADVDQLLAYVNDKFATSGVKGVAGLSLAISGDGLALRGASAAHGYQIKASDFTDSLGISMTARLSGVPANQGDIDALDALYDVKKMTVGYDQIAESATILGDLIPDPAGDPGTALDVSHWAGLASGGLVVDVDGNALDLTSVLNTLDNGATIDEFLAAVNGALASHFGDDAPFLLVDLYGEGLQWRNIDVEKDFTVTGSEAGVFGIDKVYAGSTAIGTLPDAPGASLDPVRQGYANDIELTAANAGSIALRQLFGGAGLAFTGEDGDAFEIAFAEGTSDEVKITLEKQELMALLAAKAGGGAISGLSVQDYLDTFNGAVADKLDAAMSGNPHSLELEFGVKDGRFVVASAKGPNSTDLLTIGGKLSEYTTKGWGFGGVTVSAGAAFPGDVVAGADLRAVEYVENPVIGIGSMVVDIDGTEYTLKTDGLDGSSTLKDLVDKLNGEITGATGRDDIKFAVNSSGTGLMLNNDSASVIAFVDTGDNNTLASDLGFIGKDGSGKSVEAYDYVTGADLNKRYIDRATTLASLNNGAGVDAGAIVVTNALGQAVNFDMSECLTIGDVIDNINGVTGFGVRARVNDTGDGIMIEEWYAEGAAPNPPPNGVIRVEDQSGTNVAKQLGILGAGTAGEGENRSVLDGSLRVAIDVWSNDTLTTLMNRISEKGYKTSIINDGSGVNPYRLTISSASTGEGSDFIMSSDMSFLGLTQTSKGRDAKILYGDPNSGVSPMVLSSATNSNSTAINGLTLDIKGVSDTYTTITVDTDKSKIVDEIKAMVEAYNEMNDLISYLDGYDPETNEPGVLFGDTSIRNLIASIDDMFYAVFNPDNLGYNELTTGEKKTWTWMDIGISFASKNSTGDSTAASGWYSTMELDTEALEEMVASNWEELYNALASQRNASDSTLSKNVAASASFNFQYDRDENGNIIKPDGQYDPNGAINGDHSSALGAGANGFEANKTIAEGENQYTVYFQKPTTISRLSIYHAGADGSGGALRTFTVEYMDAGTGKWEVLREIEGNTSEANHLGLALPTSVTAIRITATSTNAADGKFRLMDVQAFEDTGLAGQLNQLTTNLGDVTTGFMAERQTEVEEKIKELEDQMERMNERLEAKEASLWTQFNAMETALSQLQSQSNMITSMLGSLSSSSNK